MNYKIEKAIEVPPIKTGRYSIYPFRKMEVGDSFFSNDISAEKLRAAASYFGLRNERKYMVRKVDGGARCWRIK